MIYKFRPILKSTIWGGERISSFKNILTEDKNVGESWEISGVNGNISVVINGPDAGLSLNQLIERDKEELLGAKNFNRFGLEFPLLIKFIDAAQDLSIQVHPNDELAKKRHNSYGKTEMWYVIDTTPEAHLMSGLKSSLTPDSYIEAIRDNTIIDKLQDYRVRPGDVFFLPAGRIHSIGAGCFVAEIQQTSDITYRIYDFNRVDADGKPRQLHTELSKDAIDYTVEDNYRSEYDEPETGMVPLVECPYFTVNLVKLTSEKLALPDVDSFIIVMSIDGETTIKACNHSEILPKGQTALIPASSSNITLQANNSTSKALIAYID